MPYGLFEFEDMIQPMGAPSAMPSAPSVLMSDDSWTVSPPMANAQVFTRAIPENPPTVPITQATFETNPIVTTAMIGSEAPPTVTKMAVGENTPIATTMMVGEEGQPPSTQPTKCPAGYTQQTGGGSQGGGSGGGVIMEGGAFNFGFGSVPSIGLPTR